jgi:sugar lactone lactonase YvrE
MAYCEKVSRARANRLACFALFALSGAGSAGCLHREVSEGMSTPESILYDRAADIYLVSNINGRPFGEDGAGYISRVRPDGTIESRTWIQGTTDGLQLRAPKGMAIVGDTLWVADVNVVRQFHRTSGAPLGALELHGATFLNDVAAGSDGTVYVSDSGFFPGFQPSGTDAIWAISGGAARSVVSGAELGQPNGLLVAGDELYYVSWTGGELRRVHGDGRVETVCKLPAAQLDGIVKDASGRFLISSWEGHCIYAVSADGTQTSALFSGLDAPADLGFDQLRGLVLLPSFNANKLDFLFVGL